GGFVRAHESAAHALAGPMQGAQPRRALSLLPAQHLPTGTPPMPARHPGGTGGGCRAPVARRDEWAGPDRTPPPREAAGNRRFARFDADPRAMRKKDMITLGINAAFHDSAAALV